MSSNAASSTRKTAGQTVPAVPSPQAGFWTEIFAPLASLRTTVVLLACSIVLILVGTLAQVDKDMWEVIRDYFRSWIAWVDFQVFFPRSWFPEWQNVPGGFWFPGGAAIGAALAVNLLAAYATVFTVQARGVRLWLGLIGLGLGIAYTAMVITGGHNPGGLQGEPPVAWSTIWLCVKIGAVVIGLACAGMAFALNAERRVERRLLWGLAAFFVAAAVFLFAAGNKAYLGDSGMRILWQLIQASFAATILLIACYVLFGVRGGRVLLHGGVALVMFGQFYVSQYDIEEQVTIQEGQTASFARDIRQTELAISHASRPGVQKVSAIPLSLLLASEARSAGTWWERVTGRGRPVDEQGFIADKLLPFRIQVLSYFKNARLRDVKPAEKNEATAGTGLRFVAAPVRASSGADSGGRVDMAAAYVRLTKTDGSADLGTYLVSQIAAAQDISEKVKVDGVDYELTLRFRQNYKPYSLTLIDVRKDDYIGTSTPRNYSSNVRLVDPGRNVDREVRIWMNNPLRYAGETFYQSGYQGPPDFAVESTTLQVVTNSGWMIPYVACMIAVFGMGAQFSHVLIRFLQRRTDDLQGRWQFSSWRYGDWGLALFLLVLAVWLASTFVPPRPAADGMNIYAFGQLPLVADGRVKPFDTLARSSLRVAANRETFRDSAGTRQPASRWLLDVIANPAQAEQHRVFRIVNMEVLDTLGLNRRKGNLYSLNEIRQGIGSFEKQVLQARQKEQVGLSIYEHKLLELDQQLRTYMQLVTAFEPINLPPLPTPQDSQEVSQQKIAAFRDSYSNFVRKLEMVRAPLAVPLKNDLEGKSEPQWQSYARAWTDALIAARLLGQQPDPAVTQLEAILVAYGKKDAAEFNKQVAAYHDRLQREPPAELQTRFTPIRQLFGTFYRFEAYYNHVSPFFHCAYLYLVAFILAAFSWLGWSKPLNRAAFLLVMGTLIVHTLALWFARVYISGRPPVTNLYSSAVFIGWGVVVLAVGFEWLYRNGMGNAVASALGFASLLVAHSLAAGGDDTFKVLQAVLDTQFWLATHVVCITFGYATTFLAGGLGILYILRGVFTPSLEAEARQELTRMIYGTICFGIFFSFFGTVLGGLWADDSWGRFWGWDPKENGALIIVIWNAMVLHARWGRMVEDRGLAVLAVGGNIVTAWSWFGVNELGVGLHSYGFTEGVLLTLGLFVGSQLAMILLGCLPVSLWLSTRARSRVPAET
jgi:ABC-type transport system involved in cytochrome c biogenesis permease subunit